MTAPLDILTNDLPAGPWILDTPTVATFVLVGASDELTGIPEGLAAAIADCIGEAVNLDKPEATPPDVPWIAAVHVPALPAPLLCWPEAQAVQGTGLPDNLTHTHGLIVQTLLHPRDPLTCLINVSRLLAMIDPAAPGVLDADTGRWLDRELLERDFLGDTHEPPEDMLWVVEAMTSTDGACAVASRGLQRCGRAELHVHGVPCEHLDAAANLVASVAALSLETPLPDAGVIAEVGPGLHVQAAACEGGVKLVDQHQQPPLEVLQRLGEGVAGVYRTDRAARRQRALAHDTWADFLDIAASAQHECLVEVPFEDPTGEEHRREHLWMRVESIDGTAVHAKPVHEAMMATGVDGSTQRVEPGEVASWRVLIDEDVWGPERIDGLKERLQA